MLRTMPWGIGRTLGGILLLLASEVPLAPPPQEPEPLRRVVAAAWMRDRAEIWVLCEAGLRVRAFDPWLRERPAPDGAVAAFPAQAAGEPEGPLLRVPVWGGRVLRVDRAAGDLRLEPTWWETPPRLVWGPGRLTLEVRSALPLQQLGWRRSGDARLHTVRFRGDRFDGILQRATIEGLAPGETLELAVPAWTLAWPPRRPEWHPVRVPPVDPAGPRPTAAWPPR